jgi:predicted Zn-dependent protease
MRHFFPVILSAALVTGCAVNPVTGDREFMLVSSEQELALGAQNYVPTQQSQGGPYDTDPVLTQYVQSVGQRLAAVSDVPLPYEFTVLNNSVPNAWALPGGKIAINRGLLTEINSEAELAAVLGHEIVHAAARHTAQQMSRGMLMQGLVVATSVATNDSSYGDMAVGGASVAAQLVTMKYGRGAELESDKYGMRYMSRAGYDPQGAVELQRTFVRLSEGRDADWLSGLFASHPPSNERVEANIETAAKLPAGGTLGVDSFRAAMQKTVDARPAYDAYDEGRKALSDKKPDEALALAEKALDLYPAEAHFHALRGDVRLVKEQYDMAVTNYDRAIARRDGSARPTRRSPISSVASTCCRPHLRITRWAESRPTAETRRLQSRITRLWPRAAAIMARLPTKRWRVSICRRIRRTTFRAAATPGVTAISSSR